MYFNFFFVLAVCPPWEGRDDLASDRENCIYMCWLVTIWQGQENGPWKNWKGAFKLGPIKKKSISSRLSWFSSKGKKYVFRLWIVGNIKNPQFETPKFRAFFWCSGTYFPPLKYEGCSSVRLIDSLLLGKLAEANCSRRDANFPESSTN